MNWLKKIWNAIFSGTHKSSVTDFTGKTWTEAKELAKQGYMVSRFDWPRYHYFIWDKSYDLFYKQEGGKKILNWEPSIEESSGCVWTVRL